MGSVFFGFCGLIGQKTVILFLSCFKKTAMRTLNHDFVPGLSPWSSHGDRVPDFFPSFVFIKYL